jgi:hypothetical protein
MLDTVKHFYGAMKDGIKPGDREYHAQIATLLTIPFVILLLLVLGGRSSFNTFFIKSGLISNLSNSEKILWSQVYMTSCAFLFLMVIPSIIDRMFPLPIKSRYGFKIKGIGKHFQISFLLILVMVPVLWISFKNNSNLSNFYPVFKPRTMQDWMIYELIYMQMFLPTEFFFRGLFLYRLEHTFKQNAVWIAIIGYAVGHVFKPFPEAIASIFAGYILGVLSIQCRSIWPGVVVHIGVAFIADVFAMLETGYFNRIL